MREISEEPTAHAGQVRQRVLSLADRLHKQKLISFDQYAAADMLRMLVMAEMPSSSGISSYGDDAGRGDAPHSKADRLGRRLTGWIIDFEGRASFVGGRRPESNTIRLRDALTAAVGVYDEIGERRLNRKHAVILVSAVAQTEDMPSLAEITHELTNTYGANSRKVPAYALGTMREWLGNLAMHFRLVK